MNSYVTIFDWIKKLSVKLIHKLESKQELIYKLGTRMKKNLQN